MKPTLQICKAHYKSLDTAVEFCQVVLNYGWELLSFDIGTPNVVKYVIPKDREAYEAEMVRYHEDREEFDTEKAKYNAAINEADDANRKTRQAAVYFCQQLNEAREATESARNRELQDETLRDREEARLTNENTELQKRIARQRVANKELVRMKDQALETARQLRGQLREAKDRKDRSTVVIDETTRYVEMRYDGGSSGYERHEGQETHKEFIDRICYSRACLNPQWKEKVALIEGLSTENSILRTELHSANTKLEESKRAQAKAKEWWADRIEWLIRRDFHAPGVVE